MEKTLTIRVSEEDLRLWKDAAWGARVSLSEWVRRRCDAGLVTGGENEGAEPRVARTAAVVREALPESSAPPVTSPRVDGGKRSFRPDPKGGPAK